MDPIYQYIVKRAEEQKLEIDEESIGNLLSSVLPKKYATRKLPRFFAYVLAYFHPKMSIKQVKNSLGSYVGYDVGDSFSVLDLPNYEIEKTFIDSIKSIEAQD